MPRFALILALFAVGCGSRTLEDGLFDVDGGAGGGSGDGAVGTDGGTLSDDGVSGSDGGTLPLDSGSVSVDSGAPGAPITCGGKLSCDSATQDCCLTFAMGSLDAKCEKKGACMGDSTLGCSSGAACPKGEVCCLTAGMGGGSSSCQTMCKTGGGGGGGGTFIMCTSDAECPMGLRCRNSRIPGVKVCARGGGGGGGGGGGM